MVEISLGDWHACARNSIGEVACWGGSESGIEGINKTPTFVPGLTGLSELSVGWSLSCGLRDGGVTCWGANWIGQLGDTTREPRFGPVDIRGLGTVTDLSVGSHYACAVQEEGTVVCWGDNGDGQLGYSTTSAQLTPTLVPRIDDAIDVSAADRHTCVLRTNGTVTCFGDSSSGQVGVGVWAHSIPPATVALHDVVELDSSLEHTCARLRSGAVACWGSNDEGELGDGTLAQRQKPVMVKGLDDAVELALGFHHSCARRAGGEVWCWGSDGFGELGDGPSPLRRVRTEIPGLADRRCGDGALFVGEGCDDQNTSSGDGCSELCQVEADWKCTGEPSRCRAPVQGEDCLDPIPLNAPGSFAGSLEGMVNDYNPKSGDCTKTWATGGDAVFAVTIPAGAAVEVTATSDADLVLYASTDCAELLANCFAASDVNLGRNPETITLDNLEGTSALEVFVVVDSYLEEPEPFTLEFTLR